jgi:hypothetical protein
MKRGILIYALGHPYYYQMAVVLASSIKVNDPIAICLVTDHTVKIEHAHLFDSVTWPVERSIMQNGQKQYIKSKLFMFDHSPYEETLFLDVDQVLIKGRKLSGLFDELKDVDITFSNTGVAGSSIWADIKEVQQLYGDKPFWNYHSELVYFKKTAEVKRYFKAAVKVYEENKIKSATRFANANMADELAFQAAAIITGVYPHKEHWTPNFWYDRDRKNNRKYPFELTGYITYSIGGNAIPAAVKSNYNTLAKYYFATLGLSNPYQVVDKQSFLPERKLV